MFGGEESAVRSTKSLRSSVSGQGVSSRSELEIPDDEDQKSSEANRVGREGAPEGVARRGGGKGGGGRPEVLDTSPTGLYAIIGVSTLSLERPESGAAGKGVVEPFAQVKLAASKQPTIV